MRRIRSLATRIPILTISMLAVALSIGGGAFASAQAGADGPGANLPRNVPALTPAHHAVGSQAATSAGITFHGLSLANGWQSENTNDGTGNPRVGVLNGVVYLKGSVAQPTPGSSLFAQLPSGDRPVDTMLINTWTSGGNPGTLEITTDGRMFLSSSVSCGSGDTAQCFTSLATISWPVGS
jgi:hypothetical protein